MFKLDIPDGSNPSDCIHVNDTSRNNTVNRVITASPYKQLLVFEYLTAITEEHLQILNATWRKKPYMFMAVSQLLAGSLLVDGGHGLLLNGVESYNIYPSVDSHFENVPQSQESYIPNLESQYSNMLKITRLCFDNPEKLLIGTKTADKYVKKRQYDSLKVFTRRKMIVLLFEISLYKSTANVLAISSIRIVDFKMSPEVANNTLKSSTGKVLPIGMDPLVHMRQLRSQLQQRSTYSLGRFYSVFTQDITVQPFSIYTLINSDSDCIIGSKFMELIGGSVQDENEPT
ncbi:hypothetical protein MFLAVUS_003295 [Mucor flavus]|uniref:Uncharacterized protein n=1 Tax=Mucor flavus TaxID=439312 RepID=A0ABP9YSP6_9FUNG